jgi:hypothetical protein
MYRSFCLYRLFRRVAAVVVRAADRKLAEAM